LPPKRTLPLYGLVQALHKRNGALPVQKPRHLASAAGRGRDSGDFGSRSPGSPNPFLAPAGVALEDRRDQIDKPSMAYWRDLPRGSLANRSTGRVRVARRVGDVANEVVKGIPEAALILYETTVRAVVSGHAVVPLLDLSGLDRDRSHWLRSQREFSRSGSELHTLSLTIAIYSRSRECHQWQ
jgi:hypothetical protein